MPSRLLQAPARAGYVARAHWQRDPENPLGTADLADWKRKQLSAGTSDQPTRRCLGRRPGTNLAKFW